jgi:Family of unknown function (DUF5670)
MQSLERRKRVGAIIWGIISVLLALWLIGLIFHIAGGLIHLLLVIALGLFIVNLLTGRKAPVS